MDRCRSLYPILLQIKSCCPCTVPGPQCPVWSDRAAAGRGRGHCSNCSNCSTGHGLQLLIVTRTSCGEAGPRGYDGQEAGIRDALGVSREQLRKATSGSPRPVPASPRCPVPGTAGIEHFLLHLCSLAGCRGRAAAGCRLHVCGAAPRLQHNCSRCTLQAGQLTREPRTAQLTSTAALQHTRSTIAAAAVRPKFGYFCDIGPVNFVPRPKVQGVQESTAVCSPEQVLQQYCSGSSLHMLATLLLQSENSAE